MNKSATVFAITILSLISTVLTIDAMGSDPSGSAVAYPKEMDRAHKTGDYGGLRKFLQSTDPAERALAAIALRDFPYGGNAPYLIKLLNDDSPLEWGNTQEETSPSQEATKTLAVIERRRISANPGNISPLRTWFSLATQGKMPERMAAIHILGELEEPLAVTLLSEISKGDPHVLPESLSDIEKADLRERAADALSTIGPKPWKNRTLAVLEQFAHLAVAVGCLTVILIITVCTFIGQRKRLDPVRLLASLIPIVLLGGLAVAMYQEYRISDIGYQPIIHSLLSGNSRGLARQMVMDRSEFPGDANAGQYLVSVGDSAVFNSLGRLKGLRDDFTDKWKKVIQGRRQWIMSRIVAENLIASNLREFATAGGSEQRINVAMTLGDLGVRNDEIVDFLNSLSADKDENVVNAAKAALSRIEKYPEWKGYPFSRKRQDG